ncbi:MAG TPA: PEGA domain-containing protein [Terriglobales bacterium]
MIRRVASGFALLLVFLSTAFAKDHPAQAITWPEAGAPVVRITFGRFKEVGSVGNQHTYMIDTTAENLWDKKIGSISFTLHVLDKDKVRIGNGYISLDDVASKQLVKFSTTLILSGHPDSIELVAQQLPAELRSLAPPKMIRMTVNSVPQDALLKVDGTEVGATPKMIQIGVGKHTLEFSKEGFNDGKFPLEIGPDDANGGSVSYELGTSAHDTIELRDGSVVNGDLESVSGMEIVVRAGGSSQHFDRNQVKRIMLVERDALPPSSALPAPKQQ